ncbi:hypothetical protein AB0L70_28100 [Kribbella sp. NPDC051952]
MAALLHEPEVRRTPCQQPAQPQLLPAEDEVPDEAVNEEFGSAVLCGW